MKWDHVILNGQIVTEDETYPGNIYIKDGKITAITNEQLEGEANETTDATGLYILPGLIDTHVHSRDGGATHKEDFRHSTQAAAAGGITTIFEMPNTYPPISNKENFERQSANFLSKAFVNFGIWGICLGDLNIDDLKDLDKLGVIGFKYFWGYAVNKENYQLVYNYEEGMENVIPPCDDGEVYRMFEEVAKTGKIIAIHAENSELINHLTKRVKAEGGNSYEDALRARPALAEELTIGTGIALAKETGAHLHILHVSSGGSLDQIALAQEEGYPITAETCPHYLFLTNEDFETKGSMMKVYPLVKYQDDQNRLWDAIEDGTISLVCSDHAPHTLAEKQMDIWNAPAGMCGVEALAPLMLNEVSEGRLGLQDIVSLLSTNPAKLYGIYPLKGSIMAGADADLTLVDMEKEHIIRMEELHSKSKVTAFDGTRVKGMPVRTIVNGVTVMANGKILSSEPTGQLVTPERKGDVNYNE
ncbi:allantoinase AllB [Sporosarcina sp. 179-K 8C2 HS]|uniref:allantoinase AllB n=1 Tax=Sporosarcina sp. 179-K 8C2 HS TaxID=3142387 RepID=UPI00399F1E4C